MSVPVFSESGPTDGDCKFESETVVVCDANPFLVEEVLGQDKSPEQSDEEYQDREESDGDGNGNILWQMKYCRVYVVIARALVTTSL